ncbi:hypothetical protein [Halosegnis marinus]|uniref:Domain of unknown function domain-containing protein n=1 Tax=Halosegnis marinus TaxID=3034023 RepID=A0ABD5ZM41_9EURY|nr:hypothetical protein [Halosegnis sp. DT85]
MTDDERDRGVLSPADRAYLRGETDLASVQSERNTRARIRDRVYDGVRDFELLVEHLDARDRALAFESRGDGTETFDGLVAAVAFLYAVADDAGVDFSTLVAEGVNVAEAANDRAASVDLDVTYHGLTAAGLLDRLERGERLSLTELAFLHRSPDVRDDELARLLDDEEPVDDGRIQSKVTSF